MSSQRDIETTSSRPRGSSDSARPRMSQIIESPVTSPSRVRFTDNPAPSLPVNPKRSSMASTNSANGTGTNKHRPPRVIRTFEEIERIVPREEWYEELECGICSHILGAPQGLVPCGHSFCGPCAWTWIKVNGNHTCPHCRVPVNEMIPLIPNIVVDQIIDRKLAGLPDGKEKEGHILERESKAADWKVLQSSIVPSKPAPPRRERGRGAMEVITNLFEPMPHHRRPGNGRRLQGQPIEYPLPTEAAPLDPLRRGVYAGLTLAEATRRGAEDDPSRQSAARRLGTPTNELSSQQSLGGYTVPATRPAMPGRTSSNGSTLAQHSQRRQTQWDVEGVDGEVGNGLGIARHARQARPSLQVRTGSHNTGTSITATAGIGDMRRSNTTSRALTSRQDRYRAPVIRGATRHNAVLVDSDSD